MYVTYYKLVCMLVSIYICVCSNECMSCSSCAVLRHAMQRCHLKPFRSTFFRVFLVFFFVKIYFFRCLFSFECSSSGRCCYGYCSLVFLVLASARLLVANVRYVNILLRMYVYIFVALWVDMYLVVFVIYLIIKMPTLEKLFKCRQK